MEKSESTRRSADDPCPESEKRFRELVELLPEPIFEADVRGTLTYANQSAFDRLGYAPEELAGGVNLLDMVALHDRGRAFENQQRHMNRESAGPNEYTMQRKDGSTFPAIIHTSAMVQNGKSVGLRGFVIDITDRKQTEDALRESGQRLHSIVDGFPIPAFVIGKDHRVIHWNKALEEISGIKSETVVGTGDHWRAFYSNKRPCLADLLLDGAAELIFQWYAGKYTKPALSEDAYECTDFFPALGEDGRWLRFTAASIRDSKGMIVSAIETLEDITDRKRAEEALLDSEERHRSILEAAIDAVLMYANGIVIYANPAAGKLLRADHPEDLIGKPYMGLIHPDDQALSAERVKKTMRENAIASPREHRIVALDGHVVHVESLGFPVKYRGDIRMIGFFRDITERKRAEEERRVLEGRLQRSEKMEALGQMAGGVAHDLNNVLGILTGYSELLLLEIPAGHRTRGFVEKILQSAEKGASIIQDLLTLARRGVTAFEVINLNHVVSDFLKTPVFEKMKDYHPRVTFRTECDQNLLNIKGSPVHLEKTLMNLASNAAESISGAGEVMIRTENRYLDKAISGYDEVQQGDYAVLIVSDTGMGIPAENREKVFEPFYTKKAMGRSGTGLGLAIVWGTVKDLHGYIDMETHVGKGTTFTLYFPVTREEVMAPQQKEPMERYIGNGESVLVVDDIAEQREIASGLLKRLGYRVQAVSGGEAAVEYLKNNAADILVLDMIMAPGIDGLETYRKIVEIKPKQKAILVSGFSETDQVREAQKLGAGAYVRKPYVMETIGVAIRNELLKVTNGAA